ncbi:MAG: lysylphosphatidylglycerol synthase domain-containing protein [Saprospiraceae bacterium]|nr:lysylphosphatidylglycerol synthase domain-containing protein [Saprospiraceae bacterium]MDG2420061.1 lysylphosphatidylglycerol synthase domain-containing protein [Saprospiraceae bacterium]
MKKNTNKKYFNISIKVVIVILLSYVIYQQVFAKENAEEIWKNFLQNLTFDKIHWLFITAVLIPINWTFETLKWQVLIKDFEKLSFGKAYQAILSGITFSLFTPNRIGEYGGRILLVKPENNWKAVIATLVGSFSQLLVLLSCGILGLLLFIYLFLEIDQWIWLSIFFVGILFTFLMLFCFYNIDLVIPIVKRIPFAYKLRRFVKDVNVLRNYSSSILSLALLFSFLRYVTYTLQYFFMLQFFGIKVSIIKGLAGIATIYLLQTSIPLPPIWDLFARGQIALEIWGFSSENEIGILASTFTLWVLNLIIPALIGTIFIVRINVLQSLGYEKTNDKKDNV